MAKFATNANGAMLLPNLFQVTESISGSVVPLAMFSFQVSIAGAVFDSAPGPLHLIDAGEDAWLVPWVKENTKSQLH